MSTTTTERGQRCGVPGCTSSTKHGAYLCDVDLADHVKRLDELPLIVHALEEAFLRQQRFSVAGLGHVRAPDDEEESPIPFDPKAGDLRRAMSRLLVRWCCRFDVVDPLGYPTALGYHRTQPTAEAMVAHLRRHTRIIAGHPLGPDLVAEVHQLHRKALAAVDRPPDLVYLGICSWPLRVEHGRTVEECDEDLYAEWGKDKTRCRSCKNQHDVKNRQAVLLAAVKDQLATAADIARGLSGLDFPVTAERIRQWKRRKRIGTRGTAREHDPRCACTCHGADALDVLGYPAVLDYAGAACSDSACQAEPLYRVGDVINLALAERERLKADLRADRQPSKAEPPTTKENR